MKKSSLLSTVKPALLLAMSGCLSLANAESPEAEAEHIVVVGNRAESLSFEPYADVFVLDSMRIEQLNPRSLVQLLSYIPGLQLNDVIGNGGRGVSLSMRGFGENGSANVLVLVNGRKLNNPSLAAPDLSTVNVADIERIEVLNGGAGAAYGDQASAGVINIVLKAMHDDSVRVRVMTGDFQTRQTEAGVSLTPTDHIALRFSTSHLDSDHFRDNNRETTKHARLDGEWRTDVVQTGWEMAESDTRMRLPGALSDAELLQDREQTVKPDDFGHSQNRSARVNVRSTWKDWRLLFDLMQRKNSEQGALEFWGQMSHYQTETQLTQLQPRINWQYSERQSLLFGIDTEMAEQVTDYGVGKQQSEHSMQDLLVEWSLSGASQWSGRLSYRNSHFDFENRTTGQEMDDALSSYTAAVNWAAHEYLNWFWRIDHGFRWPNVDENGFIENGLSYLEPQLSQSLESGVQLDFQDLNFSFSVYRLNSDNEIIYDPTANGPFGPGTGANINLDGIARRGVSVHAQWSFSENLYSLWSFNSTVAEFQEGVYANKEVAFVPEKQMQWQLQWKLTERLNWGLMAQYTGPRYAAGDNGNDGDKTSGYTVWNTQINWTETNWQIGLQINNLSNKQYDGFIGRGFNGDYHYPAPDRHALLSLRYIF